MSKLLEHEVKKMLTARGIRVPEAVLIESPGAVDTESVPFAGPYFVKAQVAAGDRAKVGGVVRAADLAAARDTARRMLGMEIRSQIVEAVMIEQAVDLSWEGYAAVSVTENPPRRVLFFSQQGGAGFDPASAPMQLSLGDADPQAFRIRRELRRIGIASSEVEELTSFLEKLVQCALEWCTYTIETNPITFINGAVVALDAKADLDDYSKTLIPQPTLLDRPEQDARERAARDYQQADHRGSLRYVQLIPEEKGKVAGADYQVASHSVGGGESMVVLDALAAAGLSATNYCDTSGSPSADKVATAARLITGQRHIAGLLFSTCIANQALSFTARGLVAGWDEANWRGPTVVRFAGNQSEQARDIVRAWVKERGVSAVIVGEETDEWQAAAALRQLLDSDPRPASP